MSVVMNGLHRYDKALCRCHKVLVKLYCFEWNLWKMSNWSLQRHGLSPVNDALRMEEKQTNSNLCSIKPKHTHRKLFNHVIMLSGLKNVKTKTFSFSSTCMVQLCPHRTNAAGAGCGANRRASPQTQGALLHFFKWSQMQCYQAALHTWQRTLTAK